MNFIEEKLAQLDAIQEDIDKMPCGDERAERVVMIDKARKEIMSLEAHKEQGKPTHKIEDRLDEILEKLTA